MTQPQTNACQLSKYRFGDEVYFSFEGLLVGTVRSVSFEGRKVRYHVTLELECEVPEGLVVGTHGGAEGGQAGGG